MAWEKQISEDALDEDTREPRRWIDKQEAVRHLVHTSIRLVMKQEDPFAIHLLINSADKMLIDLSKRLGKELKMNWEEYIKPEFHDQFFKKMRETYNYLKHADEDHAIELPVYNIMMINVSSLLFCTVNYSKLFGETTDHMTLFQIFVMHIMPEIIPPELAQRGLLKEMRITLGMTPGFFFETFEQNQGVLPRFGREMTKDLQDIIDFYHLTFRQIRAGETKSSRIFKIPEY